MTTFYVVSAGAAATLVGLLFVAVQIGPPLATAGPVGRRHAIARSTFTIFVILFALSMYLLLPGQPSRARALALIAGAVVGVVRAVRTWIPVWRDKIRGRIEFRLWQTAWLLVGPILTYSYLVQGGIAQLQGDKNGVDNVASGGFILLFIIALRNSWDLLVEAKPDQETAHSEPPPYPPPEGEGRFPHGGREIQHAKS